jgi:hypothetical protein
VSDAPRLAYPLRLHRGGANTVEQDSIEDLASSAFFALRTPPGWRPEAPGFGVPDVTFDPDAAEAILEALAASDARLVVLAEEETTQLVQRVRLLLGGAEP